MNKNGLIHYTSLSDDWRKEDKLQWFAENKLKDIPFEIIRPDKNNNWINIANNDFETLLMQWFMNCICPKK
jgi:predicted helicase